MSGRVARLRGKSSPRPSDGVLNSLLRQQSAAARPRRAAGVEADNGRRPLGVKRVGATRRGSQLRAYPSAPVTPATDRGDDPRLARGQRPEGPGPGEVVAPATGLKRGSGALGNLWRVRFTPTVAASGLPRAIQKTLPILLARRLAFLLLLVLYIGYSLNTGMLYESGPSCA